MFQAVQPCLNQSRQRVGQSILCDSALFRLLPHPLVTEVTWTRPGTDLILGLRVPLKSHQTGLHLRELYETCGLRVPSWLQVTIATSWWPRTTPIFSLQVPNGVSRNWPGYVSENLETLLKLTGFLHLKWAYLFLPRTAVCKEPDRA